MFERISTGWELAKQSWGVLKLDKELVVFPLLSGIACLVVLASFAVPLGITGYAQALAEDQQLKNDPVAYVLLFLFYLANYFVIVYFNAALVGCAIIRFKGGDPTLADGFRSATPRLPQIFAWAVVSATVGLILRLIESRSERAGQIAVALAGGAWSVATYFVVPVLVIENLGPLSALKRSVSIVRKTWGEALSGNVGIGLVVFLLSLLAVIPFAAGVAAFTAGSVVLGSIGIVVGVTWVIIVSLVSSALRAVLVAALYLYAAEGTVPQSFDESLFRDAFGTARR